MTRDPHPVPRHCLDPWCFWVSFLPANPPQRCCRRSQSYQWSRNSCLQDAAARSRCGLRGVVEPAHRSHENGMFLLGRDEQNQPAETCDMCSVQQPKQPMFIWSWWSWLVKNGIPSSWMMIIQKYPKSVVSYNLRTNHQPAGVSWAHAQRLRSKMVKICQLGWHMNGMLQGKQYRYSWILYYINIK